MNSCESKIYVKKYNVEINLTIKHEKCVLSQQSKYDYEVE